MSSFHTSVLLERIVDLLKIKRGGRYIDATLGGGGHSKKIIELGGIVLGIDIDEDALENAKKEFKSEILDKKLILSQGNFKDIGEIAHLQNFDKVDGIIFDLGVSSYQLEKPERGFSFLREGPLDMRMGKSLAIKASDLVNILSKGELYEIFTKLGEEHRARAISSSIVRTRRIKAIETTQELSRIIEDVYGLGKKIISAYAKTMINKRVFQALRIAVNNELENLEKALPEALKLLNPGGKLAVISFHSLEDRIVKQSFLDFKQKNMGNIITKKPLIPSFLEMEENSRSKSAKLRVFEKLA